MTWSSSSSGSMTSSKEEVSNFVNVILRNMSQFNVSSNKITGTGLTESDSQHKDIPKIYSSFSNDLASASTSTPKRKLNFNVPHNDGSTQTSNSEKDKENVHPLQKTFCKFCFKNGEPASVYKSHDTKGNSGIPTCPILRKYVCCFCGGTGDKAHTKKYCPLGKWVEPLRPPFRRLSNGVVVSSHNHK
ncbi:unnamed protein product [Psylliodes chrysocephalus]|uniref:Nanos-type domain-containing protein n=1 Tax=Psylliodes chrysocephalus TaxID=3402493 RepID=A0A9P0GGC4_9CUCU|nr:unnamed protein product [Psylliodes chrysocephala]